MCCVSVVPATVMVDTPEMIILSDVVTSPVTSTVATPEMSISVRDATLRRYTMSLGLRSVASETPSVSRPVEHLLGEGYRPERTVYLPFGQDEEVGGRSGAARIVDLLASRGVELEYVLDEGSFVVAGAAPPDRCGGPGGHRGEGLREPGTFGGRRGRSLFHASSADCRGSSEQRRCEAPGKSFPRWAAGTHPRVVCLCGTGDVVSSPHALRQHLALRSADRAAACRLSIYRRDAAHHHRPHYVRGKHQG